MNEVASFVNNVDQFMTGFSAYMCVAAVGSLLWHATAPGSSNPYTASQVQQMMLQYYAEETGDDYNSNGMSLQQEQDMYAKMGLKIITLPVTLNSAHDSDMSNIANALRSGYPVAGCGTEVGFRYLNGDTVPYSWTPSGNHCIAFTGIDTTGNFIVRDMASLVSADNYTPGDPQVYDNRWMDMISAVAIVPAWKISPPTPANTPPAPTGNMLTQFTTLWQSTAMLFTITSQTPPSMTTGIAQQWLLYMQKYFVGPPITNEFKTVDWSGNPIMVQLFTCGVAQWNIATGTARFWIAEKEITFA